jgi:outer membrane protein OmpA-like peptidoglycan-associated protein
MTSLSLEPKEAPPAQQEGGKGLLVLVVLLVILIAGLAFYAYQGQRRVEVLEGQVAELRARSAQTMVLAQQATQKGTAAEWAALAAAQGRVLAETKAADAEKEAEGARAEAATAQQAASEAQAEADRIRQKAEAEVNRLEAALGQIAETRRTALGLVMNLGSDHLKFAFDKAELRPEDKELLSRISGILMTAHDYTISVNGHTDDVGSDAYNQKLSERRAQAVLNYLVQAGLPPEILSVEGHGKSLPLVKGTSDAARAKNRRVELGLVNTQIRYLPR